MIHLPLKQDTLPPERLTEQNALKQIERAIINSDGKIYNATYYPDNTIVERLKAYSLHKEKLGSNDLPKCYYCESKISHGAKLQVEHYRPKAKVEAGENDHIETRGYYWLGLEWTNLLLSCPNCNGKDAKGNKFPIRGVRASPIMIVVKKEKERQLDRSQCKACEDPLSSEFPILLNPEIDHPEKYLTFNSNGYLEAHGPDPVRGKTSIDTMMLNRPELLYERVKVWNTFKKDILGHIAKYLMGGFDERGLRTSFEIISDKILERTSVEEEFTLWGRYLNEYIQDFVNNEFDKGFAHIFVDCYKQRAAAKSAAK